MNFFKSKYIFFFLFNCVFFFSFGQQKIQILDQKNDEIVPFTKVVFSNNVTRLADLDAYFEIEENQEFEAITFKAFGYVDTSYQKSYFETNTRVYLRSIAQEVQEVTVVAGENPAHRIMDLVIENRKKNNPTDNGSFKYDAYSKFVFTIDPEALASIPADTKDSNQLSLKSYFGKQHLFLIESESERKFIPPSRDKETIKAYKVSGFNDPMFSTFANEMQSFSFYENQISVLGNAYINPIALGGTRRYLFILEDTLVRGLDTVFTLSFRPRLGKNFEGLKGQLFINTNGYAIEKVIAEPADEKDGVGVKIIQEYEHIENKRWFPVKLSSEIRFNSIQLISDVKNSNIVGKGSTYIDHIDIHPSLKKNEFNNVVIETLPNAGNRKDADWDSTRFYQLTDQEKNTYTTVDSISREYKLDKKLELFKILLSGKLPLGKKINLDLAKVLDYNLYEGVRLGAGLETSSMWMQRFKLGGYFAYGFKDKAWKYGGFAEVVLAPKRDIRFRVNFQDDLVQRGGNEFRWPDNAWSKESIYQGLYIRNFDKQRLAEVLLTGFFIPNVKTTLLANYQRIGFTEGYAFTGAATSFDPGRSFDLAEVSLEFSWQAQEKFMILGETRISKGSKFPRLKGKITQGIKGIEESQLAYTRVFLDLTQTINIRGAGKFTYLASAAKSSKNLPLFLNQIATGTGGNWRISVPNTFESILPSAYFSDQQLNLFTRMAFTGWKTKLKWFQPQLSLHHAIGIGSMQNRNQHNVAFNTFEKGYYEGGIILDKLYISGFTGLGLGVFMPYGAYAVPQLEKNVTVKFSLSFNF